MRRRGEAKLLKERAKAAREYGREAGKAEREHEREMGKLDRKEKRGRDGEKIEKGRARVRRQFETEMGKVERERVEGNREEVALRRILWVVVREKGADSRMETYPYINEQVRCD